MGLERSKDLGKFLLHELHEAGVGGGGVGSDDLFAPDHCRSKLGMYSVVRSESHHRAKILQSADLKVDRGRCIGSTIPPSFGNCMTLFSFLLVLSRLPHNGHVFSWPFSNLRSLVWRRWP